MPTRFELANAIRMLAVDAVQKANSGHPGMPMGMADIAQVLWCDFLKFNPTNPNWANRDRFILSNGHGAMLHYALLHLTGFDLSIEDIKNFRQLHSKTPGHPEYGHTPGIETTTGPLGQGLANAVGMAMAEKHLAATFNQNGHQIVDHYTYVFVGDGCLMEGISHEACSLAGTFGLGKLIAFYDDNGISIDGEVNAWFTDDTAKRFTAYGWHVVQNVDGHDSAAITQAIQEAQAEKNKPSLICCKTKIGFGSPNKVGTAATHGAPLGESEVALVRKELNWSHASFVIPDDIYQAWDARAKGKAAEDDWNKMFAQYKADNAELAAEFLRRQHHTLPNNWEKQTTAYIKQTQAEAKTEATRKASLIALNTYQPLLPELMGGSADLTGSNCTLFKGATAFSKNNPQGNYIYYGVREFGMSAIMNGLALHGGVLPYGGTFLVFTDYARNAVRLSALMQIRVIYVYTHDSIGLGEDGPTHQPVEHASMLRITPGIKVWRPCDMTETAVAWKAAIEYQGPSALLLSRQELPTQPRNDEMLKHIERGAYVLYETNKKAQLILIATGSEVSLAMESAKALEQQNISVRVVSMPCCDVFKAQDKMYRESILPSSINARIAIEAGSKDYWYQFVGREGVVIGMDHFGASAPYKDLYQEYGFTVENITQSALQLLKMQTVSTI